MKYLSILSCLVALISASFCFRPAQSNAGPVIIVGGGTIPKAAIDRLIEKKTRGDIVVISCYEKHREKWRRNIPSSIFSLPEGLPFIPICSVGAVIIEGGDQWDYIRRLDRRWLQSIHDKGSPILGTSAGSMILGEYYFSAEKDTITSEQAKQNINVCLGHAFVNIKYLRGKIVDTHFNARNRRGRLEVFVEKSGAKCGIGIDESTALYIDDNGSELVGDGLVTIITSVESSINAHKSIDIVSKN